MKKNKLITLLIFLFSFLGKSQEIPFKSFVTDETFRDELGLVNDYMKEVRDEKIISEKKHFIRFEAGEAFVGEVLLLRFMGDYYRNLSNEEELYFKVNEDLIYIFDLESLPFLKDKMNFDLIKSNNNLKDYGEPYLDSAGIQVEMGELIFEKECNNYELRMVYLPSSEKYYKLKFY